MRRSLFCVTFLLLPAAEACECSTPTMCELSRRAPVIFTGKVIAGGVQSLREDPWHSNSRHVRLEVIEIFRGLAPGTKFVDVETMPTMGMYCPNPFRSGRIYLVTPDVG
jgi:hypothetical protein